MVGIVQSGIFLEISQLLAAYLCSRVVLGGLNRQLPLHCFTDGGVGVPDRIPAQPLARFAAIQAKVVSFARMRMG